jgi:hypothetical protein
LFGSFVDATKTSDSSWGWEDHGLSNLNPEASATRAQSRPISVGVGR